MGIATITADSLQAEISMIHNLADGGNLTDAELCRWLRKTLNRVSKDLTGEIKDLESNFPKITNRF